MQVVAYLRSAEADEARRKEAFEVQKFEIEDYCTEKGHSITRFIESTNPAPYLHCPLLEEALKASDEGIVIAYPSAITDNVSGALDFGALLGRNKKKLLVAWEDSEIDPTKSENQTFRDVWMNENVVSSGAAGR